MFKLFGKRVEVPSSYDIIGSRERAVIVVEIPRELEGAKKEIGLRLLEKHKNARAVLRKLSERLEPYRTRKYELLAGEEDTEVVHKEYGCPMKLDPRRVYFSPREATERQRIAKQVKEGEVIMYMFSGIAPYAWVILKRQPRVHRIIAIDSNPWATRYACENAVLNKATNKVVIIRGDVREVCEGWFGRCDRVLMTYPLGASAFLGLAMKCAKRNGIIHYYSLGPEGDPFSKAVEEIKGVARRFEILDKRLVLPYKPRVYKVCVDFRVPRSKGL